MNHPPWLDPEDDNQPFPDPELALRDPDGLLALGGNLSPRRLLRAYRQGIFPWYCPGQPILWWSPDPRMILFPERIKISRSLRKVLKKQLFLVTMDTAFNIVIQRCSEPRAEQTGSWITPEMAVAYKRLHRLGHAHCVETWHQGKLVGGLYGVAIGQVFYGESMFTRRPDASKVALVYLCTQLQRWGFSLIDCQMHTAHLIRMGAEDIPRSTFIKLLNRYCTAPDRSGCWRFDDDLMGCG